MRSPSLSRSTSPISAARGAATGLPEVTRPTASDIGTSRGRRTVPPEPGMMPSVTSGSPSLASRAAIRPWQAMASSSPPPSAVPWIAATQGTRLCSISARTSGRKGGSGVLPNSRISAPATNERPAQASTTARTPSLDAIRAQASASPARTCCDSALTGGLSMVTRASGPAIMQVTVISLVLCGSGPPRGCRRYRRGKVGRDQTIGWV